MDADETVRRYFTDRGLQKRGDIETMVLPAVVERVRMEATSAPGFSEINLFADDAVERAKTAAFLDRFEDHFYEMLDDAVARRRRQYEERDRIDEPAAASNSRRGASGKQKRLTKARSTRKR